MRFTHLAAALAAALLCGLPICASAQSGGSEVGSFPNAAPLNGSERILADQSATTVNLTPAQIASFLGIPNGLPAFVANDCLSNNGSSLLWIGCGSGGVPGGSSYSIQYNNASVFGGLLPGSTGTWCFNWSSLSAAPTLVSCGSGTVTSFEVNGTGLSSSTAVNFENSAATDGLTLSFSNPSAGIVQLGFTGTLSNSGLANSATTVNTETCTLGSTCTIPFDINSSALTSQAGLNFITSTTNSVGLTATPSNPGTNEVKWEITGSTYTGSANEWGGQSLPSLVSGEYLTNNGSTLSWGTPSGSGITLQTNGTNNSSQTALNIENGQGIACSNPSSGNVQCATTQPERTVTGTSDTVSCTSDSGGVILYDSSSAVAVSVPQATSSCGSGFGFTVENAGAGTATLTPTTSTINGLSSLAIPTNSGCSLWSDGTNYQVAACRALSTLVEALGSVTTVTPNCAYSHVTATITGAATINTPTGCTPYTGQRIFLDIQSASSETYTATGYITGSTTGSWPASSTGSSKDDHFELIYDGYLGTPGWTLAAYNMGL